MRRLRFGGYGNNSNCAARTVNANNSVGNTNNYYGLSATFEQDNKITMLQDSRIITWLGKPNKV